MRLDKLDKFDSFPERDGELDLPDDLAAMSEQLADDAQRLATCYPPQFGPVQEVMAAVASLSPRRRAGGAAWFAGASAAGAVALGLAIAVLLQSNHRPGADPLPAAAGITNRKLAVEAPSSSLVESAAQRSARQFTKPTDTTGLAPPPALLEQGVTGPELEALMDLQRLDNLAFDTESVEF